MECLTDPPLPPGWRTLLALTHRPTNFLFSIRNSRENASNLVQSKLPVRFTSPGLYTRRRIPGAGQRACPIETGLGVLPIASTPPNQLSS